MKKAAAILLMAFSLLIPALVWADSKTCTITLDGNGGTFPADYWTKVESPTIDVTFDVGSSGDPSFVNVGIVPSWGDKHMTGWSTKKDATAPEYYPQTFQDVNTDASNARYVSLDGSVKRLYATWTESYWITLDANGGDFGTETDRYGKKTPIETLLVEFWSDDGSSLWHKSIPDAIKRNSDEIHKGWSADKNATRPEYSTWFSGLVLNSSTPKTLYAIYGKEGDKSSDYGATDDKDNAGTDKKTDSGSGTKADSSTDTSVTNTKKATKITAPKKTYKAKTKVKKYTATLKDSNNKPVKNAKLTLKVNGKTYKATTTNSGKATFKITKLTKKGTFTAVIKFAGNKNYKATSKNVKIKVKK